MQTNSSDTCMHCYNVAVLNVFEPKLQQINTKPTIKKKLKELLSELKKSETIGKEMIGKE